MKSETHLLIDTHLLLWARFRPGWLRPGERRVLDGATVRYLSVVVFWEAAILLDLRRIENEPTLFDVPAGFEFLPIRPEHCRAITTLARHHRDPFDRMLIAQAKSENVPLLTRDSGIAAYRADAPILVNPGG